ncbi:hypothetical protein M407DRAFT_33850 [Tulasnella calospora MUT 4182]|uniref:Uncharacterized protein n=1 Tax=Tulasnella calospora MUT 4182 TaxID=1051891 RepID=A0A0C3L4G0_9AGAM|nr:hypothetical protein M407DRAFT_33850 [Tulasnella calospora MUT 4182]
MDDDDSRSAGDNGTTESSVGGTSPASSTSVFGSPGLPAAGNADGLELHDPRVPQYHPSHHGSLKNMNA